MQKHYDDISEKHLAVAQEVFGGLPVPENNMRGIDFYPSERLPLVYKEALGNFFSFFRRVPDPQQPALGDALFYSKFFRPFPTVPSPASKYEIIGYLRDEKLLSQLRQPIRSLPIYPDDLLAGRMTMPTPKALLKLDKGNNQYIRLRRESFRSELRKSAPTLLRWFGQTYGISWGEWFYGIGQQYVFFEEDLSELMTGLECQIYIREGKVTAVKITSGLETKGTEQELMRSAYFDRDMNFVPGAKIDGHQLLGVSAPDCIDLLFGIAEHIGKAFTVARIDFILTREGPSLGEISLIPANAKFRFATQKLENLILETFRLGN